MTDVRTELRWASRLVDVPDRSFERLVERRERVRRRGRVAALAVALFVAAGSLGGVAVLSRLDAVSEDVGAGWEPSRRLALEPGEYFYLWVTSDEAVDGHIRDEETWWGTDGSGEIRNRSTRQDKYPYPPSGTYGDGRFPIDMPNVSELSTDPDLLIAQLHREPWTGLNGTEPDPIADFVVRLLIETPYATPELRAALFEVASGLDSVTVIEDTQDPAGRLALALETSERDGEDTATWRTYFDPGTHQAIAWTFESTRGGSAWILLESAIVDSAGERPGPGEWLVPRIGDAAP